MNEVEVQGILQFSLYVHNDSEWDVCKRAFKDGFMLALRRAEVLLEQMHNLPGQCDINMGAEQIVEMLRGMLKEEA